VPRKMWNLVLTCSLALLSSCFRSYETDLSRDADANDLLLDSGNYSIDSGIDKPSLLGNWQGDFQVYNPNGISYTAIPATVEFTDTGVVISVRGTELFTGNYVIDSDQMPQQIDLVIFGPRRETVITYTFPAIYKIENNVLTLTAAPYSPRPQSFSPEGDQLLMVFELAKNP
jgi:uncharacterized protein (TIGR03067 family)